MMLCKAHIEEMKIHKDEMKKKQNVMALSIAIE
jgi:hypothetical protein